MRLTTGIWVLLVLFSACKNNPKQEGPSKEVIVDTIKQPVNYKFNLDKYKKDFRYGKLTEFSFDDIDWENRNKLFTKLEEYDYADVFQDSMYLDTSNNPAYFYSIQKATSDLTQITVMWEHDGCCSNITLLTYNAAGKLINMEQMAFEGGDGGWWHTSYSIFSNDSTYLFSSKDCSDEEASEDYSAVCDSTLTIFNLREDGRALMIKEETFNVKEPAVKYDK
jgi:hypothetical protein